MNKKYGIVVLADTHIGSVAGLCTRSFELDDGGTKSSNKVQKWLLRQYDSFLDTIKEELGDCDRTIVVLNGDIVDRDHKKRSWQYISQNPNDIRKVAVDLLDPLVQLSDKLFVIRGTSSHSGPSAHEEEQLADDLDAEADPNTGNKSWWHLKAEFGGVLFDIAHHVSMGRLPWTEKNYANKLAVSTIFDCEESREKRPNIVIRSDKHRFSDSGMNFVITHDLRAFISPVFQFQTEYSYRIGMENRLPHIGGMLFKCQDGTYEEPIVKIYRPTRRKIWKWKN